MVAMENGHPNLTTVIPIEAQEVLHKLASAWSEVANPEALEVVLLKGAGQMATNKVFEIKWKSNNLQDSENENTFYRKVLLRIYGEGTESVFDREDEIRVFEAVSRQGQGPKLLGRFPNGRVEEFITGRTLAAKDLHDPKISAIIATKLRKFHDLDMPGPKKVLLWDRLKNYLKIAKRLSSPEEAKEFYLDKIEEEISSLENELSSGDQMIGFCHNDLWHGNMIMNEETKMLTIIDYELACFNPVAFDIASYFCEMATDFNSEAPCIWDYNKYPNLDERKRFVQIYLNSSEVCKFACVVDLALFTAGGLASRIINIVNHGARGDCKTDDVKGILSEIIGLASRETLLMQEKQKASIPRSKKL